MVKLSSDTFRRSLPMSSGAAIIAQRLKCVRYSAAVIPPLPTSSMSGSFQCPGPAYCARPRLVCALPIMLDHLSEMSPVVRHRLPTGAAQVHGLFWPHSQIEYAMARPDFASASRIALYRCCASTPWLLQLSYFR